MSESLLPLSDEPRTPFCTPVCFRAHQPIRKMQSKPQVMVPGEKCAQNLIISKCCLINCDELLVLLLELFLIIYVSWMVMSKRE